MTAVLVDHRDRIAETSVWTRVTTELWAASDRDGFLGTVELVGQDRYAATDGRGSTLGTATTLHAAQALVTDDDPAGPASARRTRITAATAWIAGLCAIGSVAMLVLDVAR